MQDHCRPLHLLVHIPRKLFTNRHVRLGGKEHDRGERESHERQLPSHNQRPDNPDKEHRPGINEVPREPSENGPHFLATVDEPRGHDRGLSIVAEEPFAVLLEDALDGLFSRAKDPLFGTGFEEVDFEECGDSVKQGDANDSEGPVEGDAGGDVGVEEIGHELGEGETKGGGRNAVADAGCEADEHEGVLPRGKAFGGGAEHLPDGEGPDGLSLQCSFDVLFAHIVQILGFLSFSPRVGACDFLLDRFEHRATRFERVL